MIIKISRAKVCILIYSLSSDKFVEEIFSTKKSIKPPFINFGIELGFYPNLEII
jgi:hypothetical protein